VKLDNYQKGNGVRPWEDVAVKDREPVTEAAMMRRAGLYYCFPSKGFTYSSDIGDVVEFVE
jgi:hypothetical protein